MNHIFNILKRFTMIIIQYFYNIIRIVYSIGDGIINIIGLKDAVNGETLDFLLIKSNNNTEDEILKRGRFLAP
jgi:F0F1-type ATP synthase alpha subunit